MQFSTTSLLEEYRFILKNSFHMWQTWDLCWSVCEQLVKINYIFRLKGIKCLDINKLDIWLNTKILFIGYIIETVGIKSKEPLTLHRKWSFPLRTSSANVTKSAVFAVSAVTKSAVSCLGIKSKEPLTLHKKWSFPLRISSA